MRLPFRKSLRLIFTIAPFFPTLYGWSLVTGQAIVVRLRGLVAIDTIFHTQLHQAHKPLGGILYLPVTPAAVYFPQHDVALMGENNVSRQIVVYARPRYLFRPLDVLSKLLFLAVVGKRLFVTSGADHDSRNRSGISAQHGSVAADTGSDVPARTHIRLQKNLMTSGTSVDLWKILNSFGKVSMTRGTLAVSQFLWNVTKNVVVHFEVKSLVLSRSEVFEVPLMIKLDGLDYGVSRHRRRRGNERKKPPY
jgi:hypothetical protein